MKTPNILTLKHSSPVSFHNLAFFLCHLLLDGKFRTTHIAHNPRAFHIDFIARIETVCEEPIPWLITDIMQAFTLPWGNEERTDSILQLIFFDPNRLTNDIDQFQKYLTYYRVFIFSASDEFDTKRIFSLVQEFSPCSSSRTLILHYNTTNGSISLNWMPINDSDLKEWRPAQFNFESTTNSNQNRKAQSTRSMNFFDQTFGEYERKSVIAIHTFGPDVDAVNEIHQKHHFRDKYYHMHLKPSYINYTYVNIFTQNAEENTMLVVKQQPRGIIRS